MSATRTRSNSARSTSPKSAVESAVLAAIEANVKYVAKTPTSNLAAFRDFVVSESPELKSKAERDAFDLGIRLAGLRASFTKDRKAGKIPADTTFSDYAIGSSGVDVPAEGPARTALLAGIGSYTRYVAYRTAREAAKK